jgi:putative acetyltransferase
MNATRDTCSFQIRRAHAGDAEAICCLHVNSIRTVCANDYSSEQIEAWAGAKRPQHYVDALGRGEVMFIAEVPGAIAGFASMTSDEIQGLYLNRQFLRRGIGKALLETMEREFVNQGMSKIRLFSTLTAEQFYLAQGFLAQKRTIILMNHVELPCIPMTKRLS